MLRPGHVEAQEPCGAAGQRGYGTSSEYIDFCADDYTWVAVDNSYFYFAWCDRTRTFGTAPYIRPDADVKFAKIKQ